MGRASACKFHFSGSSGLRDLLRGSGMIPGLRDIYCMQIEVKREREEKIATLNGWPFKSIYKAKLALATSWDPFATSWAWSSLHASSQVASGGLPEVSGHLPRRGNLVPRRGLWQFWGFAPRTSEIHNFRIRTPFSTFFISPRRWDYALQLSFRLHWLILTLFLIYYKYITYILSLVGRDRKTPFEIHNSFIWTPIPSVFPSLHYYRWDLQFSFRSLRIDIYLP